MRVLTAAACTLAVLLPGRAFAWGYEGHEIIAAIARSYLTPTAKAKVDAILAQDTDTLTKPDMISRATWADEWRSAGHRETAQWHFVDNEMDQEDLKSACFGFPSPANPPSDGPPQDCIVDKLNEFTRELGDTNTAPAERILALKYVLHFVGDIHQPLHTSDNHDRGGNCVPISFGGNRTTNLHSYWDTTVVQALGSDPLTVADQLEAQIAPDEIARWDSGDPTTWAEESYGVAEASASTLGSPAGCATDHAPIPITPAYAAQAQTAAKLQLERAGVRLAWVLNRARGL